MAADRALAKDHEAAREDVRTLDRDRDRHDLVAAAEVILRAEADALAAVHVHRVVRDLPGQLRAVVLQHRGGHGRLLAAVDRARRHRTRRVDDVRSARHARERGFDALELADRLVELLAYARIRSRRKNAGLRAARCIRRQRDAATHGQLLDQHAPALARHLRSADDAVERHEHVLAGQRPVLKRDVEREVTAADRESRRVARNQRAGDAVLGLVAAEQLVGVVQLEGQAHHRRDRRERDVALREIQAQAEHFLALVDATADDAGVGNRRGIGAGARRRQREAGHVLAAGESRQVMVLLLLGAVMQQQFAGAERIRHGHRRRHRRAAARQFHQHAGVRVGGELETAVPLRDDHREEALLLQEVPDLGRQVGATVGDVPVVDHAAEFFARAVDERLLVGRQPGRLRRQELVPVGAAREQFAVPPHGAGFERLALRIRHRRQHAAVRLQERPGDEAQPEGVDVEQRHGAEHEPERHEPRRRGCANDRVGDENDAGGERRRAQGHALVGEIEGAADENQEPESGNHCCVPCSGAGRNALPEARLCIRLLRRRNIRIRRLHHALLSLTRPKESVFRARPQSVTRRFTNFSITSRIVAGS